MRRRATDRTERATEYETHRAAAQRGIDDLLGTLRRRKIGIVDSILRGLNRQPDAPAC